MTKVLKENKKHTWYKNLFWHLLNSKEDFIKNCCIKNTGTVETDQV